MTQRIFGVIGVPDAEYLERLILDFKRQDLPLERQEYHIPSRSHTVKETKTKPWRGFNLKLSRTKTIQDAPSKKGVHYFWPVQIDASVVHDLRNIPGFTRVEDYAYLRPGVGEVGSYKSLRFFVRNA